MSHSQKTKRPSRTPAKMSATDTRETSPQGPTSSLPDSLTSTEFRALCSSIEANVAASVRASIADTVRTAVTDAIVPLSSIDALRATVEGQGSRLKDVESGLSEYSIRLVRFEDTVSHLSKDHCRLRDKLDDLEFRSRRNNVRILNVPEKMELGSGEDTALAQQVSAVFPWREDIFFPDMISPVSEKLATFLGVKRQLYARKVRFSLRKSLHVEHSGERLVFDSAGEAQKWYDSTFQHAH
ncbi:hypothetical protein DPEC_G00178320 [Dallia pectoralis]|uniref:Uncharacterized protein n=1 Tax=Dallia pectoralis TaxID=75939 RepID=A0ACC2GFF0_DALPE|nr:hypothetical protein DPEC_G00178320 [Dallia pectoralis]